jgi:hypothetical protein
MNLPLNSVFPNAMKIRTILLFLSAIFLVFQSCRFTVYTIEEPETVNNEAPGSFGITVTRITDLNAEIQWGKATDPEGDVIRYEIAVNDSVIAYELNVNQYNIKGLYPDKEYRISVVALDRQRNSYKTEKTIKTRKSFLERVSQFNLHYEKYSFIKAIKTTDSGFLILGKGTIFEKTKPYRYFLLKLKSDFSIAWFKEYNWQPTLTEAPINLREIPGEGYFVIHNQKITRIDDQGNSILLYEVPAEYKVFPIRDLVSDLNGNYLIVGESPRHWPVPPVCTEYFLVKITANGYEIWHKYGGNSIVNYPTGIFRTDKNQFVIAGTAESTHSVSYAEEHDWKTNFWILTVDGDGMEISEKIFSNKFNVSDVLLSTIPENDGSLIVAGAAAGAINSGYNTKARIARIGTGQMIWDSCPDLETTGVFCSIDCVDKIPVRVTTFYSLPMTGEFLCPNSPHPVP